MKTWSSAGFLVVVFCGNVFAAPLRVDESSFGGDFSDREPIPTLGVGTLDIGTNTIVGDAFDPCCEPFAGERADRDTFEIILPASLTITSMQIAVTNFIDGLPDVPNSGRSSFNLSGPNLGRVEFNDNGTFALPFVIVDNAIIVNVWADNTSPPTPSLEDAFGYTITIEVVPESSALSLAILAALSVSMMHRMKPAMLSG